MDEERTEETREMREEPEPQADGGSRVDPKALNRDQEAYRQQEWDASGLEKREQPPAGQEK